MESEIVQFVSSGLALLVRIIVMGCGYYFAVIAGG